MKEKLYRRERYLQKLRLFYHDDDIIKVITGVRRCGKSCLLETAIEELIADGDPKYLFIDEIQNADGFLITSATSKASR